MTIDDRASVAAAAFDYLDADGLSVALDRWLSATAATPVATPILDAYYNTVSPRSIFLKSVPPDSYFLDMGAGEGSLSTFKVWPEIGRPDIKMFGVSLEPIREADRYEAVSTVDFSTAPELFGGRPFDAVFAAHFIEHLARPQDFVEWASARLTDAGRIYIEWPHPVSKKVPTRQFFLDRGLSVFTTNFFDDLTHVETWTMAEVCNMAWSCGLLVETCGRIALPFLAEQLRDASRRESDIVRGTFAVWTAVGWAQYVILTKPVT